jgi:hypothetical protein
MEDPNPGKVETHHRRSSWGAFVMGLAMILLAGYYERSAEKEHDRAENLRSEVDAGRLRVDAGTKVTMDAASRLHQPADYSTMRLCGILLFIPALGFSHYANKLRKKRTGG